MNRYVSRTCALMLLVGCASGAGNPAPEGRMATTRTAANPAAPAPDRGQRRRQRGRGRRRPRHGRRRRHGNQRQGRQGGDPAQPDASNSDADEPPDAPAPGDASSDMRLAPRPRGGGRAPRAHIMYEQDSGAGMAGSGRSPPSLPESRAR